MTRQAITPQMKIDCLLHRYDILCSICLKTIYPGDEIEWDHIAALVHGGEHEYHNLRPLHTECHKVKSAQDVKANAKVKRLRNPKPSKHPVPGSRASRFKRKMNGEVVKR